MRALTKKFGAGHGLKTLDKQTEKFIMKMILAVVFVMGLGAVNAKASEPILKKCTTSAKTTIEFYAHPSKDMNTIKGSIGDRNISIDSLIEEDLNSINVFAAFGSFRMTMSKKTGLGQLGFKMLGTNEEAVVLSVMCD
jgi:hypothetical protein